MTAETKIAATPERDVEAMYAATAPILFHLAHHKFRVPWEDAENLVQETFTAYLSVMDDVSDARGWLVGAVCNGSRYYWRRGENRGTTADPNEELRTRPDPSSVDLTSRVAEAITVRQTISHLHEKCRHVLRLHYFEGYTAREIAKELATTNGYAEKMIHDCLKRALVIYERLTRIA